LQKLVEAFTNIQKLFQTFYTIRNNKKIYSESRRSLMKSAKFRIADGELMRERYS